MYNTHIPGTCVLDIDIRIYLTIGISILHFDPCCLPDFLMLSDVFWSPYFSKHFRGRYPWTPLALHPRPLPQLARRLHCLTHATPNQTCLQVRPYQ